jgi:hypothetical protein
VDLTWQCSHKLVVSLRPSVPIISIQLLFHLKLRIEENHRSRRPYWPSVLTFLFEKLSFHKLNFFRFPVSNPFQHSFHVSMWFLIFFILIIKFTHGKPYDKDVFRNELNELVVRWESPFGDFFLLKQQQKKVFKLMDNRFEPLQIIELIGNVSVGATIDYPSDITGDSSGNIYVLDCGGQVMKLTPHQQNYAVEVGDLIKDEILLQFSYSSTSLCLRSFKHPKHRNSVSFSSIVSTQGRIITGESIDARTGVSVSIGADVNGDGKSDMLIGANEYSSYTGRAYLIYGSSSLTNIALGSLTSTQGIIITGESSYSFTGCSVNIGGDVNGDGKADMLIGAYGYSSSTGRVYLIYGSSSLTNIALGSLTSTQGITITGVSANSFTGISVNIGGDVNGDGKADMLIGAHGYSSDTGQGYLIYGSSSLTDIALGSLTSTRGIIITGESANSETGYSVSIGGDVNGDGKADMLIGAYGYSSKIGRVYLIYGSSSLTNIALGSLTSTQGIAITGESLDSKTGGSVSIGGDVNGDGKADMLIGAPAYSSDTGRVYLIYGSSSLSNIALGSLTSTQGLTITGDSTSLYTGGSVSIGGDVNGDGQPDMLIAAPAYSSDTGRVSLLYGSLVATMRPSGHPTSQPISPTSEPTLKPTCQPSSWPTVSPTSKPTSRPTTKPSSKPSHPPSSPPTRQPWSRPTTQPSTIPSTLPSTQPTLTPTRHPASQPTSTPSNVPTSRPTCSLGEAGSGTGCMQCRPGYYALLGAEQCMACPIGQFQTEFGRNDCDECAFPWTNTRKGSTECSAIHYRLEYPLVYVSVATAIVWIFVFSAARTDTYLVPIVMNLFIPSFDAFTNLGYLLSTTFSNVGILVVLVLFAVHPILSFMFKLYILRPVPGLKKLFPVWSEVLWLRYETGDDFVPYPVSNKGRISFFYDTKIHDSLYKLAWELLVWILAIVTQALYVVLMWVQFILFLSLLPVWFGFGVLLELTNTLSIGRVWDIWFKVWTGSDEFSEPAVSVDSAMMNYGLVNRLLFETVPVTIIQIINNELLEKPWTPIAILSIAASSFTLANLLYRYFFYQYCLKNRLSMKDIPIETSIKIQLRWAGIDRTFVDGKLPAGGHSIILERRKALKVDPDALAEKMRLVRSLVWPRAFSRIAPYEQTQIEDFITKAEKEEGKLSKQEEGLVLELHKVTK